MDLLRELRRAGAVLADSHFVYTSGRHGATYIDLDRLLPDLVTMTELCRNLAEPFRGRADVVAAPATGAIPLAVLTAQALAQDAEPVDAVWADKTDQGFVIERAGFAERLRGRRTLVVEDLLTTGSSVAGVLDALRNCEATVVGVSVVCNRGGVTARQLGVSQLNALADIAFTAFDPASCPLCQAQVPIVEEVGHGREFRRAQPSYAGGYVQLV